MSNYQAHITQLQQRFETALTEQALDAVLIYSGQQAYAFRDDNALPFRVNPYFKYWLPLTEQQQSFLLIRPGEKPHLYLFQQQDYWHAQPVVPEGEWQDYVELSIIDDPNSVLKTFLSKSDKVALVGEFTCQPGLVNGWQEDNINHVGLLGYLDYHRAYKTEYEIDCMRKANELACYAHLKAKGAFFDGRTELQIHQTYLAALNIRETALPYNNIIAFNENASVLHYDHYQTITPTRRRSFLIDAGASYKGYHADISRTYIDTSAPDANEFNQLYLAYQQAYHQLVDDIQIGKPYLALHDSAHRKLSHLLSEFDIVNCSGEDAYRKGYSQLFFPCGTGHYIGLQVHDVGGHLANDKGELLNKDPRYPFLRMLRPIEQNTVFTVEPGIYFIDQLLYQMRGNPDFNWTRIEQLKAFGGFRMEDCLAVTRQGVENLSEPGFN